jgi:hypothetical protein
MLPKLEMAMNAERMRCGWSSSLDRVPKVSWKNKRATLFLGLSCNAFGTTTICAEGVSKTQYRFIAFGCAYICNIN